MRTARPLLGWRILAPIVLAFPAFFITLDTFATYKEEQLPFLEQWMASFIFVAFWLIFNLVLWRARISWDANKVGVRNVFQWTWFRWEDVASIEATYSGIVIRTKQGQTKLGLAAQRANASAPDASRADRIVADLEAERRKGRGASPAV